MIRIILWLLTGFWWTPQRRCVADCVALRSGCKSGLCLIHCCAMCVCGAGKLEAEANDIVGVLKGKAAP